MISYLQQNFNKQYIVNKQAEVIQNHQFSIKNRKVAILLLRSFDSFAHSFSPLSLKM